MNQFILEWIGYTASFIVLISLLMSSIIKLRWINLIGSVIFAVYGFLISSIPVGIMNCGIAIINIYYLTKIYSSKELFQVLPIEPNSEYFRKFINFYDKELKQYFKDIPKSFTEEMFGFFVLRDMVPAGIFVAKKEKDDTAKVLLDYAIPAYRDFKIGHFIYEDNKEYFLEKGIYNLIVNGQKENYNKYLEKMRFKHVEEQGKVCYIKSL